MKRISIYAIRGFCYVIAVLPSILVNLEYKYTKNERVYQFWADFFALIPGIPGSIMRSVFYKMVLSHCSLDVNIYSFVSIAHRETLRFLATNVQIGSKVSLYK